MMLIVITRICTMQNLAKMKYDKFIFIPLGGCSTQFLTEPQSIALREAIKEYETNKWKVIGQKVGKPAKVRLIVSLKLVKY